MPIPLKRFYAIEIYNVAHDDTYHSEADCPGLYDAKVKWCWKRRGRKKGWTCSTSSDGFTSNIEYADTYTSLAMARKGASNYYPGIRGFIDPTVMQFDVTLTKTVKS